MTGYEALRQSAAVYDVSGRGRIRATGEDRQRLLHAMTTNHVQEMTPGQTKYAFFLNAQGRITGGRVDPVHGRRADIGRGAGGAGEDFPASGPLHHCRRCHFGGHHGSDVGVCD